MNKIAFTFKGLNSNQAFFVAHSAVGHLMNMRYTTASRQVSVLAIYCIAITGTCLLANVYQFMYALICWLLNISELDDNRTGMQGLC